jgi:L-asparaginase / beta-aspartyl-peptidase
MSNFTLVIHGGAGTILRKNMSAEKENAYRAGLDQALAAGFTILSNGGTSIDAVRAAVVSLEDNDLFNAGRGSVFAKDGSQEMDASIMNGSNLHAGAVSAVKNIRNPIELAYAVMSRSPHVMLNGHGANDFAASLGMRKEPDEYFYSAFRHDQWKQLQGEDTIALDHNIVPDDKKFGTVGAVACDSRGNIAAATSTGGMTNKQWGRVGDSSIIGAGTYANNNTCAISCTGHGEIFIRAVAAYDVSCLMEYQGLSLQAAMERVTLDKVAKMEGEGGMIGVDAAGNAAMVFNSEGMYRGVRRSEGRSEGRSEVAIYK